MITEKTANIKENPGRIKMEFLKSIFTNIDFHLNAQTKTLTITYGENHISLRLTEDGKVRFDTNLVLDGPSAKANEAETK